MLHHIAMLKNAKSGRASSWNQTGANGDCWKIPAGSSVVLADITGPGCITHIWMTQIEGYRESLIKITFDDADGPSILCPLGDFFCVGHGKPQTFQSYFFSASKCEDERFLTGCALNCYLPMPFRKRAVVELINESDKPRDQFFYIDYETYDSLPNDAAYLHAEFRRVNPFGGWGGDATLIETGKAINKEEKAWRDNYVILDAKGPAGGAICRLEIPWLDGRLAPEHKQLVRLFDAGEGVPRNQRPWTLHWLQHQRHQFPGHVVGRGRRHDLGGRLQVAAGPARHRHRRLLQPGLGHSAQRVPAQRVIVL